jgi:CHAD domain-containing protein/CYTH domain-containing protein
MMPPRAAHPALPADLLARTPEEAVRRLAHELLAQATEARDRLTDPADDEALHDFRVAIRRLRSTVRAYGEALSGSVGRKARRRLRDIARATGGSRDLEVQLAWVETQRGSLNSRHRPGASWLRDRWRARKQSADAKLAREVGADFERLRVSLAKTLPVYWQKVRIDTPLAERRFATLLAGRLREASAELGARLAGIRGPEDVEPAHDARISAKRVRYLLEPAVGLSESAGPVVKRLRKLQELLGELHDLDVLAIMLADALADAEREIDDSTRATLVASSAGPATASAAAAAAVDAATATSSDAGANGDGGATPRSTPALVDDGERGAASTSESGGELAVEPDATAAEGAANAADAVERREVERRAVERRASAASAALARDPRPGLVALARRASTRREALFGELAAGWLGRDAAGLVSSIDNVAATIEAETAARTAPLPMEIERKYLLRSLPHTLRGMPSAEIVQGWLPGTRLLERLRRVTRGADVRHFRTVKLGSGVARVEIEEETAPELFELLWPATRERRVRKRRYAVAEGELTWEVDVFAGRDLVLAEVELPTADTAVTVPGWLAPYVVQEVTDDSTYVNVNLASADPDEPATAAPRPRAVAQVRTLLEPRPEAGERPRIVERSAGGEGGTDATADGSTPDPAR